MYAYPLCLLFLATGQFGGSDDREPPSPLQVDSSQTLSMPQFQQPQTPLAPVVAPDVDRNAAPSFSLQSVYEGPDTTPAPSDTAAPAAIGSIQDATAEPPANGSAASLLSQALRPPAGMSIEGTPVSLKEVLAQAPIAAQQTRSVSAYWQLSQALAEYHFALDESQFFRGLPLPQAEHHRALLAAQEASAAARTAAARVNVLRAQHALAETSQLTDVDGLPLPADRPFIGAYRTHFKVLNEHGAAPDRLGSIDRSLPVMRESIDAQASAVAAGENALGATQQAYQQGQAAMADVLSIYHDLRRQRRDFLATVTEYNQQIARYASSVSLPGARTDRLVRMLIETPDAERSVLASKRTGGEIRRVSNEEEVGGWSDVSGKRP